MEGLEIKIPKEVLGEMNQRSRESLSRATAIDMDNIKPMSDKIIDEMTRMQAEHYWDMQSKNIPKPAGLRKTHTDLYYLLDTFKDGKRRYQFDPIFRSVVESLVRGGDPLQSISELLDIIGRQNGIIEGFNCL